MTRSSGRLSETSYGLMRLILGSLFACHGAQKIFGVLGGHVATSLSSRAAGVIELAGGALIAAGLFTTLAALLASVEMAVGYFWKHAPAGFWPIRNRGELAVVYCFVFLFIATAGSGPFSLERWLSRRARRPA
jgi:putative oxidoreductase